MISDELSTKRVNHVATVTVHEDPVYDRQKLEGALDDDVDDDDDEDEGSHALGVHVNVCALGDQRPGVQLPQASQPAMDRLDEVNMFLHGLLFHGLWVDGCGQVSSMPGLGHHPVRLHLYVELPALFYWPLSASAEGASGNTALFVAVGPVLPAHLC
jgi:hypothetical protein